MSARRLTKADQASDYFREVLSRLDAHQILYGILEDGPRPIGQISGARDPEFGRRDQETLRGLRYLSLGLRTQPFPARELPQAEIVEEWLGIVATDGNGRRSA